MLHHQATAPALRSRPTLPQDRLLVHPARAGSRQRFEAGQVMPEVGGDYGATIWQWDELQD
jgi:hypothetical protein